MVEPIERAAALLLPRPGCQALLAAGLDGLGLALPAMGRFLVAGDLTLARVAPHQAVALGTDVAPAARLAGLAGAALVIDWSDACAAFALSGPAAAARLARLVPIDVDALLPGGCARTLVARIGVLLLRHATDRFELFCARSYAGSLAHAIGT